MWIYKHELCSLVGDGCFMCGGLKPPLDVVTSQICQGTSLLKPATQTCLDVAVHIPMKEMIIYALIIFFFFFRSAL